MQFTSGLKIKNHSKTDGSCVVITSDDGEDVDYLCNLVQRIYGEVKSGQEVGKIKESQHLHRELKVDGKSVAGGLINSGSEAIYESQLEAILNKYGRREE